MKIKPEDLKIDYYSKFPKIVTHMCHSCCIEHLPTGVVVVSEKGRYKAIVFALLELVLEECL